MQIIQELADKAERYIIGLMSGTSCNGLDIARIRISGNALKTHFELLNSATVPYSSEQKQNFLQFLQTKTTSLKDLSQLNFYLPTIWNEMIQSFFEQNNLKKSDVDLIASHGQTIWHEPEPDFYIDRPVASTMQLGDPAVLAQLVGIPVIGDFRVADVALGGQGAPLIPYFDWIYFSRFKRNILTINIGGISNLTFIPADGNFQKVQAFDCGPGNMLIDAAAINYFNLPFDQEGQIARKGQNKPSFLNFLKENDPFLSQLPPKSTGREIYGTPFFKKILKEAKELNISGEDVLYNLTDYTAFSIFDHYKRFIQSGTKTDLVLIGGGGARNSFLMERLGYYFNGIETSTVDKHGLDSDFKEAIGFAVLANETINGIGSNVPAATGASRRAILGKICLI